MHRVKILKTQSEKNINEFIMKMEDKYNEDFQPIAINSTHDGKTIILYEILKDFYIENNKTENNKTENNEGAEQVEIPDELWNLMNVPKC